MIYLHGKKGAFVMKRNAIILLLLAGTLGGCSKNISSSSPTKESLSTSKSLTSQSKPIESSSTGNLTSVSSISLSTGTSSSISSSSSQSITVYHTVTFNPNNGEQNSTQQVENGKKATKPTDPTKTGYTFTGWVNSQTGEAWSFTGSIITKDITLIATYRANQYTITFDTDGGSSINPISQDYGSAIATPANPTKTGYTFAGWDKAVPETMPAQDVEIKANWTVNQYTISFDTDGGSAIDSLTQDYGSAIVKPTNPTKTGYNFAGWDAEIPSTMPAENIEIKAKWEIIKCTVSFVDGFGNEVSSSTVDYGSTITAPSNPENDYYEFDSWNTSISDVVVTDDMTITATWTSNSFTFDGTSITGYTGTATSVVIPAYTPTGKTVTSIGKDAFKNNISITSVTLPEGITSIGETAFYGCSSLTSINIPSTLTSIGKQAFNRCTSLLPLTIPTTLTKIGQGAFYMCRNVSLFCEATSKPSGFNSDWSWYCPVIWDATACTFGIFEGFNYYIKDNKATIYDYTGTDLDVVVPDTLGGCVVASVATYAFHGVSSEITSVTLPEGMETIASYAFYDCEALTSVTIPTTVTSIGLYAFRLCKKLNSVTIPEGVTSISYGAFQSCSKLASLSLPESLTSISTDAFNGCVNLTSVALPSGVTSLGDKAFSGCSKLASVTLSDSLTSIGASAFASCKVLTSIVIPTSVTTIGKEAFYGCVELTIYCEAQSVPTGWNSTWNVSNCPVNWNYVAEE